MKKIIIFGSGAYSLSLVRYLGRENVKAICDNSCLSEGIKYDVRYIPFLKMLEEYKDSILILAMNMNNSRNVIEQLLAYGVEDFLILSEKLMNIIQQTEPEKLVSFLNDDIERYKLEKNQYIDIWRVREEQFSFLRSIVDAKSLKSATGYLELIQKRLADFATEVFESISELKIRPFLVGGSLLGYYRNRGYIPWDDDLDFGLFRDEYKKLLEYGRENMVFLETEASISACNNIKIESIMRQNPNKLIMLISPNCLQIKRGKSEIDSNIIDFFPYDYYSENYEFSEHTKLLDEMSSHRYTEVGNAFFIDVIDSKNITVKQSNNIYFGLDNIDSFTCKNDHWISRDTIEPLKKISFENIPCFIPNDPGTLLSFFYNNYMELPDEFSSHHRIELSELVLKHNYIYCAIYISKNENVDLSIPLYKYMREKGIYCVFCVDWRNKSIKDKLLEQRVEMVNNLMFDIDFFLDDDDIEQLKYQQVSNFCVTIIREKIESGKLSNVKINNLIMSL